MDCTFGIFVYTGMIIIIANKEHKCYASFIDGFSTIKSIKCTEFLLTLHVVNTVLISTVIL